MSILSEPTSAVPPDDPFTSEDDPASSRISYLSGTTTGLISCVVPIIVVAYLLMLSWVYKYSLKNPRPLNKTSGLRLQKYAPGVYVFVVLASLAELALSTWLILQYRFNHNYPSIQFRTGTRLLLFASSWTSLTGGIFTLLFLHPTWSKNSIASVGAQAVWILTTWLFWVIGLGLVNPSIGNLLDKGTCAMTAYCSQIRALYGVALTEILSLTLGMFIMLWLAWDAARFPIETPSLELNRC